MDISRLNELFFEHNCVASMNIEMMDFKVTVRPTHLLDPDAKGDRVHLILSRHHL